VHPLFYGLYNVRGTLRKDVHLFKHPLYNPLALIGYRQQIVGPYLTFPSLFRQSHSGQKYYIKVITLNIHIQRYVHLYYTKPNISDIFSGTFVVTCNYRRHSIASNYPPKQTNTGQSHEMDKGII